MLPVAVAKEEKHCVGFDLHKLSLLPLGCSFGQRCCSSEGKRERHESWSGREENKRDRIVWKLSESR